jgi:tetratricopeptide (TPR) repeat protein
MATSDPPATAVPPQRRRWRFETLLLVAGCLFLVGGVGRYLYQFKTLPPSAGEGPELPAVDENGLDPAIVAALERERQAVRRTPQSASAWGRLGMVLLAHNFPAQAESCLATAERLDAGEPRWPYYQGLARENASVAAAVPKFEQTVALCGDVPPAPRLHLANALLGLDRFDEAEQHYRASLQHYPDNGEAHLGLARIAYRRDDLEGAVRELGLAVRDARLEKDARALLAQVYQRQGKQAAADEERRRMKHLHDSLPLHDPFLQEMAALRTGKQAAITVATVLLGQGRYQEVLPLMEKTAQAYPDSDKVWITLGTANLRLGRFDQAGRAFRTAQKLAPDSPVVHYYLGLTLLNQKDDAGATDQLRRAVALKPDLDRAYFALGCSLERQGNRPETIKAFRTYLRYQPDDVDAKVRLCEALTQEGQHAEALVLFGQALRARPTDPETRKRLYQQLLPRLALPLCW